MNINFIAMGKLKESWYRGSLRGVHEKARSIHLSEGH